MPAPRAIDGSTPSEDVRRAPAPRAQATGTSEAARERRAEGRRPLGSPRGATIGTLADAALSLASSPWVLWKKARRIARNPRGHADEVDPRRWFARVRRGDGGRIAPARAPHVVFVGKSFGELRQIERLDAALRARHPRIVTTWCGQMAEFLDHVARRFPAQRMAAAPFDGVATVFPFVARLDPDLVVFVERVLSPLLARTLARAGVPVLVANAIGPRPLRKGRVRRALAHLDRHRTFAAVSAATFPSDRQRDAAAPYLRPGTPAAVVGSLKLDLEVPAAGADDAALAAWLAPRPARPLFVAGSTRRGDEAFVLEALRTVARDAPPALLLAPRQPERADEVAALAAAAGFGVARFSRRDDVRRADVLLLDVVGALPRAYAEGVAAFVGGTLRHLGQNVAEPLHFGLPVAFGTAATSLDEVMQACVEADVGARVASSGELAAHWRRVLEDPSGRAGVRVRARDLLAMHRGAAERTVDVLAAWLDRGRGDARPGGPRVSPTNVRACGPLQRVTTISR